MLALPPYECMLSKNMLADRIVDALDDHDSKDSVTRPVDKKRIGGALLNACCVPNSRCTNGGVEL